MLDLRPNKDASAHGQVCEADSVAIIGVGLRLPGGITTLAGLWRSLLAGEDLVTAVTGDRFDVDDFVVERGGVRSGKSYSSATGIFGNVWAFDASYFGISPKEAGQIDPQQRMLLECAVEAFDDGGVDPRTLAGSDVAVVMGLTVHDYEGLVNRRPKVLNSFGPIGTGAFSAANRLSYLFDFRGPSHAVDTACSSSLTALHLAAEAVRSGRSDVALAGGVNLVLGPGGHVTSSQASMLSPTGRCHPFSEKADGFVRAEGAGVVLLKALSRALADGDRVHAVIRASVINSDGRTVGMSMPGVDAQAAMLERAYAEAGVRAEQVSYVEAHGTGTPAGDPVECEALGRVLGRRRGKRMLPVGSVKSNLGHLEAAAGMAGIFKAMLVLRERQVPATLHTLPLNPAIDFAGLGLDPVTTARPLEAADDRLIAGVNSFGAGGANAHVVLEIREVAPERKAAPPEGADAGRGDLPVPVVVTGRSEEALRESALAMAAHLEGLDRSALVDVAFTTSRRRERREFGMAVLATNSARAARALREAVEKGTSDEVASASSMRRGRVGFVFSGNGTPWPGMGAELLEQEPDFAAEVRAVSRELEPLLGWSVEAEMAEHRAERWPRAEVAQPMLFALQAGLTAMLRKRGVVARAVCGHSVGEVAAAYCAGLLDRARACRLIAFRSLAQAPTFGKGRMAAVALPAERARELLVETGAGDRVVLAAVNSDGDVTLSGAAEALEQLEDRCLRDDVGFRFLRLDYAYHSPAMDSARDVFLDTLGPLQADKPVIPLVSTVSGRTAEPSEVTAEYWWRNVREPVRFDSAVTALLGEEHGCDVLVEIGPHPALSGYVRRIAADRAQPAEVVPTLTRIGAGPQAVRTAVLRVLAAGGQVDWDRFLPHGGRVVDLPAYAWQREHHRLGGPQWWTDHEMAPAPQPAAPHPLLGRRLRAADPTWGREQNVAWFADHRVGDAVLMPGTAFLTMALSAAGQLTGGPVELLGTSLLKPLVLPLDAEMATPRTTTTLYPDGGFVIASHAEDDVEAAHLVTGNWRPLPGSRPTPLDLAALTARMGVRVDVADHYRSCAEVSLAYGPSFRPLTAITVGEREALIRLQVPTAGAPAHLAPAVLLDGCLQAMLPLAAAAAGADGYLPYLPAAMGSVRSWSPLPPTVLAHLRLTSLTETGLLSDITVCDTDGQVLLELRDARARRIENTRHGAPALYTEVLRARPRMTSPPGTPSPLRAPALVSDECGRDVGLLDEAFGQHRYGNYPGTLRQLGAHFMAAAVDGFLDHASLAEPDRSPDPDGGADFTLDDVVRAGVQPKLAPLVKMMLGTAVEEGLLAPCGEQAWRRLAPPRPDQTLRAARTVFPELIPVWQGAAACGLGLPGVLAGTKDPLDVLFGEADPVAADLYDRDPVIVHLAEVAVAYVRAATAAWPADRPLRILEVGAGTGSFTARLLPHLPAGRTHYLFTDVSAAFFPDAETRFAAYDFLDHRTFDLDTDPVSQGLLPGSVDLIVASNALHAGQDISRALRHAAELLSKDGQLVAVELHSNTYIAPMVGLLDSFWHSLDTELRPAGPLLPPDRWTSVLEQAGLHAAAFLGAPSEPNGDSPGSVIAAVRSSHGAPAPEADRPAVRPCVLVTPPARPAAPCADLDDLTGLVREALGATGAHEVVRAELGPGLDWTALLPAEGPVDVVLLIDDTAATEPAEATAEAVLACAQLSSLAACCARAKGALAPVLWLVAGTTADAVDAAMSHRGAALWGAARTLANEQPYLAVRKIRAVCGAPERLRETARHVVHEITRPDAEDECVITAHGRFALRVRTLPETLPSRVHGDDVRFALVAHGEAGARPRVVWQDSAVPAPGPGRVTVRVMAAALNARDALLATGHVMPTGAAGLGGAHLGCEGAGVVTAVGAGVTGLAPGDRVAGVADGGWLASHVTLRAQQLVRIPRRLGFAAAAALPTAYLSARHVLGTLTDLAPGARVVVQGATGAAELAAVDTARQAGVAVIAAAPTPAQRCLLSLSGAEHVVDCAGPEGPEQVRQLVEGRGVDVVLDFLPGQAGQYGLAPGGHFFGLGPREAARRTPTGGEHDATLHTVDVVGWFHEPSPAADRRVRDLQEALERGECPPLPHTVHSADRVQEAMDRLLDGHPVGKSVIALDDGVLLERAPAVARMDPEATYLITGGLDGFGAATALYLARRGARHLTLVSRRGTAHNPAAAELVATLTGHGVAVDARAVDVSRPEGVARLFRDLDAGPRRLAGVVHGAMVLDDDEIVRLTPERFHTVLDPKLTGALLLHDHTHKHDLDFFLLYSSFATLLGNLKQAAYSAASLALENLAHRRRSEGLPATVVQLGAISDVGYVQRTGITSVMSDYGFSPMTSAQALARLDTLLLRPDTTVTTVIGAGAESRADALAALLHTSTAPRTSVLVRTSDARTADESLLPRLRAAATEQEAHLILEEATTAWLASVLHTTPDRIDPNRRIDQLGADSLTTTALVARIRKHTRCTIPAVEVMTAPLSLITASVLRQLHQERTD
ncbi:type I polyketide synthase [Streptomyces sp. NBC_01304]|uniref:type I polyketide synthase n=1 Tax=Streptomyces sp. NBC_01304 TaxID=2903818 RepID=UPI002E114CC2|nr:type I polyketide synthase [Streptomyces sp. NBC_01304]